MTGTFRYAVHATKGEFSKQSFPFYSVLFFIVFLTIAVDSQVLPPQQILHAFLASNFRFQIGFQVTFWHYRVKLFLNIVR